MTTHPVPISVQLYSLRDQAAVDFGAVLMRLGEIGFVGVELAGFHGMTTTEFNSVIGDAGLVVSSAHVGNTSHDAFNTALDDVQAVGCDTAVVAFLPPATFGDADEMSRAAEEMNALAEIAASRSVSLGYHNHWWEFEQTIHGRRAWDVFFEQLSPTIFAELDIYWATVGGADPVKVIADLGDRLRLVHVKDGPANDPAAAMVAVGSGEIDVSGILGGAPQAAWHIVELDRCDTDMFEAIAASHRYLTGVGLSKGRA